MSRLFRCAPEHVRSLSSRESDRLQADPMMHLGPFPKPVGSVSQLGTGVFQYQDLVPTVMPPEITTPSISGNGPIIPDSPSDPIIHPSPENASTANPFRI